MSLFKLLTKANSLRRQSFFRPFTRMHHDDSSIDSSMKLLVPLRQRSLIKVSGSEAQDLLQGLITNDMRKFEYMGASAKSLYALFLSNRGKILYDALIYRWIDDNTFLIECDAKACTSVQQYLTIYKGRRGIDIKDIHKSMRLWALISPTAFIAEDGFEAQRPINVFKDPRVHELGYRVIADAALTGPKVLEMLDCESGQVQLEEEGVYKYLRYRLGVPEGTKDLLPGEYYATEANSDVLNGLSLLKGCYIGRDITERMQLTGKIKSRMMPLQLPEPACVERNTSIISVSDPKTCVGKVVASMHDMCLGTINIQHALVSKGLKVGEINIEVLKPAWWSTSSDLTEKSFTSTPAPSPSPEPKIDG